MPDDYRRIAEQYNHIGLAAKAAGIQFGYHNHHFEFEPLRGEKPLEILLNNTDPEGVVFEMDMGWVVQSGNDPLEFIRNYPGRFPLWHLRDVDQGKQSVNAGEGIVDFQSLFQHKKEAGFVYGIIETPSAAINGLERIAACYKYFEKQQR
ncbi:sugar phosphate isomerase [Niabella soli DSM 19437]|uniref:Sugar phosphate isomerase n=1 Tax=Niabella soli DSM 19437 TaxID=929713 RepID=W0F4B0_9BACT|nr:sugar phosphate isomerase [Niabella soli DSM 19437]